MKFSKEIPEEILPGLIVSVTGHTQTRKKKNGEISLSSTLPTVILSSRERDKAVFGAIVSHGPLLKITGIKLEMVSVSGWPMLWAKDGFG